MKNILKDFFEFIKEIKSRFTGSRLLVLGIIYSFLVFTLISRLFKMQIVNGEDYLKNYIQMTERTVTTPATRGNIYDINGKVLAYNKLSYAVTVLDNGDYKNNQDRNTMLLKLIEILNYHEEKIEGSLEIGLDQDGNYYFTSESTAAKKRFLRDYYGLKTTDDLDDTAGKYPSEVPASDLIAQKIKVYGIDKLEDAEGNLVSLDPSVLLSLINIRYTMSLTAYQRYESTTVASDVSEETKAHIEENASELLGVGIEESALRVYNDSIAFSSIIGYVGKVQDNQLEELHKIDPDYALNDIVGRTGIEQYMESDLHGKKGSRTIYVDNVGHIKQVTNETPAYAGNDVYLSIDRDLQVGTYHLLEQHLAGILSKKIVNMDNPNNEDTDSTQRQIPVKDAYFQLINNNVISVSHMSENDASETEKTIESKFESYRDSSLEGLRSELTSAAPKTMNELPEDMKTFMNYIYTYLSSDSVNVIQTENQNMSAEYMTRFQTGDISMSEFLHNGIADGWIDTTKLNVSAQYSSSEDIFTALIDFALNSIRDDNKYVKLNYKYLVSNNIVSGNELCVALMDQGVVEADDAQRNLVLNGGSYEAYSFLINKISNIEITPAQLALDPCTAGCVVTDVNTGKIKALVSYPGYDNNRLTNTMDAAYYAQLLDDQSLPLYNNATQAKKAPGSTFKPITAVAGLEERVIGLNDTITCTGLYDVIEPPMSCWIYPGAHGALNLIGGIRNSCNYYFGEVGHRLSLDASGNYSVSVGIDKIRKYASLFGLDHKSGVEINETDPMISNENPERSAIGQGTHAYANVQLSRYVAAVANRGNVFELSILDRTVDAEGITVKTFEPQETSHIDVADSTWNAVQQGMREVIEYGSASQLFNDLEVNIAGKTGTAQESKVRANHAFFISFGPYENPEIAVTVNIPYGYSSSNAAAIAKDVYRLDFGYTSLDYILNTGALDATDVKIGD